MLGAILLGQSFWDDQGNKKGLSSHLSKIDDIKLRFSFYTMVAVESVSACFNSHYASTSSSSNPPKSQIAFVAAAKAINPAPTQPHPPSCSPSKMFANRAP